MVFFLPSPLLDALLSRLLGHAGRASVLQHAHMAATSIYFHHLLLPLHSPPILKVGNTYTRCGRSAGLSRFTGWRVGSGS